MPGGAPLRLHVRDWGGAGAPVLLLHGLASSSRIWDRVAPALAERFRTVGVDQRGHGQSDRPRDYSFDAVCGDIPPLLDALGFDSAVVCGHSWGANVAVQLAADHPDRVNALTLVDGGVIDISERMSWEEAQKRMRPPDIDGIPVDQFLQNARRWPDLSGIWGDDLAEMILSTLDVREGRIYRRLPVDDHMQIVHAIYEQNTRDLLGRIECPTLAMLAAREPSNDVERAWDGVARGGRKSRGAEDEERTRGLDARLDP